MIISAEKMALGGRTEIQDGGSQHVVDVGTGIRGPDGSLLDPIWRIVAAILTSVSCLFLGSLGVCRPASPVVLISAGGGSGPSCVIDFMSCVFLLDVQ